MYLCCVSFLQSALKLKSRDFRVGFFDSYGASANLTRIAGIFGFVTAIFALDHLKSPSFGFVLLFYVIFYNNKKVLSIRKYLAFDWEKLKVTDKR